MENHVRLRSSKRNVFRYQCTPYTVEFERMLVNLEGSGETFGGSLERTQFERLYQSLQKIESIASGKVKGVERRMCPIVERPHDVFSSN